MITIHLRARRWKILLALAGAAVGVRDRGAGPDQAKLDR
jgi:hypothetical protein